MIRVEDLKKKRTKKGKEKKEVKKNQNMKEKR